MKTLIHKTGKKSEALISAIIVLALVLAVVAVMHLRARGFRDTANLQLDTDKAYSLAKSGVGVAESFIPTGGGGPCSGAASCDIIHKLYSLGGNATITIDIDPCNGTLTSTGKVGKSVRFVKKTFPPVISGGGNQTITFAKAYNGFSDDLYAWFLQPTSDGGYIMSGNSTNGIVVVKADQCGNALWGKRYSNSTGVDRTQKTIRETSDGGYLIGGFSTSFGNAYQDLLIKTDSNGTPIWNKTYGGARNEYLGWITPTTVSPGYMLVGWNNTSSGDYDALLIKTDPNGTTQWARTYNGTAAKHDVPLTVQELSNGSYVMVGWTNSFSSSNEDIFLMGLSSTGTINWQKYYTYASSRTEKPRNVLPTSDGGWIIAAQTNTFEASNTSNDSLVIKTNATGTISWAKTYGVSGVDDKPEFFYNTSDGGYLMGGVTNAGGNYDLWLMKINSTGDIMSGWPKKYGGTGTDIMYSFWPTSDGFVLGGYTSSFGSGSIDFLLIKTDTLGEIANCSMFSNMTVTVTNRTFTTSTPTFANVSRTLTPSNVSVNVTSPTVTTTTYCSPP